MRRKLARPRVRRSPDVIIAELEAKLERLGDRSDRIVIRLEHLRRRYAKSLALSSLEGETAEELEARMQAVGEQTRLLRTALKTKRRQGGQAS
jgi:hypothetical protein